MTTFGAAHGIPVLAKSTAEHIGEVKHFVVEDGRVHSLHVEGGKHGQLVAWEDVASFGDDAVVVENADVLRDARNEREARALRGELVLLGKLALTDAGDELGQVTDVTFEPDDGRIVSMLVNGDAIAGDRLLGIGSYAVVVGSADDA
jgi:uncharacterized protein YrrD